VQQIPAKLINVSAVPGLGDPPRSSHWNLRAVAGAVLLGTCLTASNAWGLALGRASVQSGLGEPLRAEIDLPAITSDENASLQVGIASPTAHREAETAKAHRG